MNYTQNKKIEQAKETTLRTRNVYWKLRAYEIDINAPGANYENMVYKRDVDMI